jgi:hypothetical protein
MFHVFRQFLNLDFWLVIPALLIDILFIIYLIYRLLQIISSKPDKM